MSQNASFKDDIQLSESFIQKSSKAKDFDEVK